MSVQWRWRWLAACAVVVVSGWLVLGPAAAQKKDTATQEEEADGSAYVTDLGTAFQLIDFGRANKSPAALLMAAGLLRSVGRAELKPLDATIEGENDKGEPVQLAKQPEAGSKPDLNRQATNLIDEAALMPGGKLPGLTKAVSKKGAGGDAGVVYYRSAVLEAGQTQLLRVKVRTDERTDVALQAGEALQVSLLRDDKDRKTLAATLTSGGNIEFMPTVATTTRGVRVRLNETIRGRRVRINERIRVGAIRRPHQQGHHRCRKPRGRRGIGEGEPVLIRISNPTNAAVEYTVFVN